MHIGAQRVGADIAEREGLSWAALWRVSQNWNIATCFRSDSKTALGQAEGTLGTSHIDESFAFLRGAHQAVDAALGPLRSGYKHVPGHVGEHWNELCDWLAKAERQKSFYCKRPGLDMGEWKHKMRHLWMVFGRQRDLPKFCGRGLHAPAPSLPPPNSIKEDHHMPLTSFCSFAYSMSACTANVNSLCAPPDGHAGKIAYLRAQFKQLNLMFLGIQESKTDDICTCVDKVYRLGSGGSNHQQGVELWINLAQPYGHSQGRPHFFDTSDFQIAHKDPRILLVRADTCFWNGWLLVAYAPQSGIAWSEREQWWHQLSAIAHRRKPHEPIIVMIDANASPGGESQANSSGTPLLRGYLEEHDLHMPSATSLHQGPTATWTDPSGHRSYCIDYSPLGKSMRSHVLLRLVGGKELWKSMRAASSLDDCWRTASHADLHDFALTSLTSQMRGIPC